MMSEVANQKGFINLKNLQIGSDRVIPPTKSTAFHQTTKTRKIKDKNI